MKMFGNAALNWQPFVITINTRQMFLHKFKHQERVKMGNCWKNVLSLTSIENNSITLIFPGWKKVLRLALQILDSREGLGIGEVVFSVFGGCSFLAPSLSEHSLPRMLVFGKYFMLVVVKSLNRKD